MKTTNKVIKTTMKIIAKNQMKNISGGAGLTNNPYFKSNSSSGEMVA